MKAVLCPVCGGTGKVTKNGNTTAPSEETCHGCGGKGWVEVGEDKTDYTPYIPYPTYPWYPNQPYPWYYDPYTITYYPEF